MIEKPGIYHPRNPFNSPFYQCIADHYERFEGVYEERYEREYGFWRPVIHEAIQKFLECGDLSHGFARVRCDHCGHEYLLAFSCKGRYFCPSCHMKRVLTFSEWLTENVLEDVTHQQYVFTIPKIIRPYFKYNRKLLGKLCLCAWETIKEFFGVCLPKGACPGAVISIQSWGNTANFHPHLHGLVTKGGFTEEGTFYPLPFIDTHKMAIVFRSKVLNMLIKEEKITPDQAQMISSWPHPGFNIHNEVKISSNDQQGRIKLAQYIIKAPISLERMIYNKENQKVIYKSKKGTVVFDPLDWLAAITSHIPDKYAQNVRYYGFYSSKSRGMRNKDEQMAEDEIVIFGTSTSKKRCSKKWASLIKRVYEIDPLCCPRCCNQMRILALIDQPEIIEKILKHLNLWLPIAHSPPGSDDVKIIKDTTYDYFGYNSFKFLPQ
jgi:hypothetical protein